MTGLKQDMLDPMISLIKEVEPGYSGILPFLKWKRPCVVSAPKTKTVCTFCGVGRSFEVWTKGRKILKVQPSDGPVNAISTCVKGNSAGILSILRNVLQNHSFVKIMSLWNHRGMKHLI